MRCSPWSKGTSDNKSIFQVIQVYWTYLLSASTLKQCHIVYAFHKRQIYNQDATNGKKSIMLSDDSSIYANLHKWCALVSNLRIQEIQIL